MTKNSQLFLLESLGCIRLTGPDTIKFLQGQITINAELLVEGVLTLGAVCNPQGRCVGLFWASKHGDDVMLFQLKETISETVAHFSKYAVFFKTEIIDISDQVTLVGNANQAALESVYDDGINKEQVSTFQSENSLVTLLMENNAIGENLSQYKNVSPQAGLFFSQLVNHKIPWLTNSTQNQFLPHNLNLPELSAVDFKKGCFTGQEVIARMQYKGKLKSHIQVFKSQQKLAEVGPLSEVFVDGKKAGEVVCGAIDENENANVLVLLKDKYQECEIFRMQDENGPILELVNHS